MWDVKKRCDYRRQTDRWIAQALVNSGHSPSQHEAVGRRSLSVCVCCDAVDDETQGILILPGCDINTGKLQPQRRYNTSPLTSLSLTLCLSLSPA